MLKHMVPFVGMSTAALFWCKKTGQIYNMRSTRRLRCAYSNIDAASNHAEGCSKYSKPIARCSIGKNPNHKRNHDTPLREKVEAAAFRWLCRCLAYLNPGLTLEDFGTKVLNEWPFFLTRNPRFVIDRMEGALKSCRKAGEKRHGRQHDKDSEALFGSEALEKCRRWITKLTDPDGKLKFWAPPLLGTKCRTRSRLMFCNFFYYWNR